MTARLARATLRLYPLAYQRRYADEMRALLEERPASARTVLDLLRGALVAHLRPRNAPANAVSPDDRVRATVSGVLMCWVVFAAAGFGYYKTTEDQPYSAAGHVHPLLRDAHLAVQAVALLASAAIVLGALPLILAALERALRDPRGWRTVARPILPLIVLLALTAGFVALAHANTSHRPSTGGSGAAVVWGIAGLVCAAACVLGCRAALFATPVQPSRLRAALFSGTLVTTAMFAIAVATVIYAVALGIDAAQLAADANGPFQVLSVTASLIIQAIVMAGAAVLAAITTRRGWRVRNALEEPGTFAV